MSREITMDEAIAQKFDYLVEMMGNWSSQWETHILRHGAPLDEEQIERAKCVGVAQAEKVRVLYVPNIPLPHYPLLYRTFVEMNLYNPAVSGLTCGYGIFLKADAAPQEYWLAHELVHVGQYERLGGIKAGLRQYLEELFTVGYEACEMELEAHRTSLRCLAARGVEFDFGEEIKKTLEIIHR